MCQRKQLVPIRASNYLEFVSSSLVKLVQTHQEMTKKQQQNSILLHSRKS